MFELLNQLQTLSCSPDLFSLRILWPLPGWIVTPMASLVFLPVLAKRYTGGLDQRLFQALASNLYDPLS
jgi:hypothetical protein